MNNFPSLENYQPKSLFLSLWTGKWIDGHNGDHSLDLESVY